MTNKAGGRAPRWERRPAEAQKKRLWLLLGGGGAVVALAVGAIVAAVVLSGRNARTSLSQLPAYAHTLGPAGAAVTVVEFADFQ